MAGGSRCSSLSCSIRSCGCCTCCCPECAAICDSLPPSSAASEALASSRDSSSCCSGAMLSLPWSRASSVSSSWLATPSSAECSAAAMGAEEEEEGCGLGPSSSRVVEPAGPSSSDTELAFVSGRRRVLTMWMRSGLQSEKVMDLGIDLAKAPRCEAEARRAQTHPLPSTDLPMHSQGGALGPPWGSAGRRLHLALLPSRRPLSRAARRVTDRPTVFFRPRVRRVRVPTDRLPGSPSPDQMPLRTRPSPSDPTRPSKSGRSRPACVALGPTDLSRACKLRQKTTD